MTERGSLNRVPRRSPLRWFYDGLIRNGKDGTSDALNERWPGEHGLTNNALQKPTTEKEVGGTPHAQTEPSGTENSTEAVYLESKGAVVATLQHIIRTNYEAALASPQDGCPAADKIKRGTESLTETDLLDSIESNKLRLRAFSLDHIFHFRSLDVTTARSSWHTFFRTRESAIKKQFGEGVWTPESRARIEAVVERDNTEILSGVKSSLKEKKYLGYTRRAVEASKKVLNAADERLGASAWWKKLDPKTKEVLRALGLGVVAAGALGLGFATGGLTLISAPVLLMTASGGYVVRELSRMGFEAGVNRYYKNAEERLERENTPQAVHTARKINLKKQNILRRAKGWTSAITVGTAFVAGGYLRFGSLEAFGNGLLKKITNIFTETPKIETKIESSSEVATQQKPTVNKAVDSVACDGADDAPKPNSKSVDTYVALDGTRVTTVIEYGSDGQFKRAIQTYDFPSGGKFIAVKQADGWVYRLRIDESGKVIADGWVFEGRGTPPPMPGSEPVSLKNAEQPRTSISGTETAPEQSSHEAIATPSVETAVAGHKDGLTQMLNNLAYELERAVNAGYQPSALEQEILSAKDDPMKLAAIIERAGGFDPSADLPRGTGRDSMRVSTGDTLKIGKEGLQFTTGGKTFTLLDGTGNSTGIKAPAPMTNSGNFGWMSKKT